MKGVSSLTLHLTRRLQAATIQLEDLLRLPEGTLMEILKGGIRKNYRVYQKKKRSGGFRTIRAPQKALRKVQKAIKLTLLDDLEVSGIAHAYIAGRGIDSNASPHLQSCSMVEFDLESAYDSVSMHNFISLGVNFPYCKELLGKLCFDSRLVMLVMEFIDYYHNHWLLPQGAVTSPQLFNLFCRPLDEKLIHFASNVGGVVTRYADNIYFSWPDEVLPKKIEHAVERIITRCGFTLNAGKTRIQNRANRLGTPLRFPGINVMNGKMYMPRSTQKRLRAMAFNAGIEYAEGHFLHSEAKKDRDPAAVNAGIKGYEIQSCGGRCMQVCREFQHGRAVITGEKKI